MVPLLDLGSLDGVLLEGVRLFYKKTLLRDYREGFSNHEVDFFNLPTFDIGIGRKPLDNPWGKKFGDGLHVLTSLIGTTLPDELVNSVNADIASSLTYSQMGNVVGAEWDADTTRMRAFIPHLVLARWARTPENVAMNIVNFVYHCAGTVSQLQRDFFGVSLEQQRQWPDNEEEPSGSTGQN